MSDAHINLRPLLNSYFAGSAAEKMATIRHGASAMSALYNASIPIFTVVIRRAFGVAGGVFADPEDGRGERIAWYVLIVPPYLSLIGIRCRPSGDWGSLPLEGGLEAAYKRQLDAAESPAAREKMIKDLLVQFEGVRSPMTTANKFVVEEIVDPRDTRPLACEVRNF